MAARSLFDAAVARATPDAAAPVVLLPLPRASDVQRIQSRLASAVARCIAGADVGSSVSLVVTYQGRNGHATWVHIPGPANAEPMASCLEAAVIQYTVPPFATPTWQTTYTFSR